MLFKNKDLLKKLALKKAIKWNDNYLVLLDKINITLFPSRAWALTLQKIKEKSGEEYVFKLGEIYGKKTFQLINQRLNELKFNISKDFMELPAILEISGIGKIELTKDNNNLPKIEFIEHQAIKYGIELYGKKAAVLYFYSGTLTSFYNLYNKTNLKFIFTIKNNPIFITKKNVN